MAKILLVEDDSNLREIYGARLEAEGYTIVAASDGEEALALAVKERPDLIISDIMMPKISGFDMLDILRTTPETKNVKVIVMTALSQDEDRRRGEELGADRYLVKSQVTLDDVVQMVKELLADMPGSTAAQTTPSSNPPSQPPDNGAQSVSATSDPLIASTPNDGSLPPQPSQPANPPSTDISVSADGTLQQPPQSSAPTANTTATDAIDPNDAAALTKEVEQFVATSPLMNGTAPQPAGESQVNPTNPTPAVSQPPSTTIETPPQPSGTPNGNA